MNYAQLGFTQLLQMSVVEPSAKDALYTRVYNELRGVASRHLNGHRRDELQTTALVNEVILRIERSNGLSKMASRRVFFSVATLAMKQAMIDQYRIRKRRIESGVVAAEPLDSIVDNVEQDTSFDFELLSAELDRLEVDAPRQHAVIMHRYFGGLTIAETADLLETSKGTVERDWRLARAKLFLRLSDAR